MTLTNITGSNYSSHSEKYSSVVNYLGFEKIHEILNSVWSDSVLIKSYKEDTYLNNLKLSLWEGLAGYKWFVNPVTQTEACVRYSTPFNRLLREKGINAYSSSECVCILKECVRLIAERNLEKEAV